MLVKKRCSRRISEGVLIVWAMLGLVSCGGSRVKPRDAKPSPLKGMSWMAPDSFSKKAPQKLWSRNTGALITDLGVSRDGAAVVVATAPDPDVPGSGSKRHVERRSRAGKLEWRVELSSALRMLDLTHDASLVLASSYDSEVFALGPKGKKLWSFEAVCRPVPFSRERILCYHDDDAEPHVAFDVLSHQGKKLAAVNIEELLDPAATKPKRVDILALEVSDDLKTVVVALTGGRVIALNEDLKPVWRAQVDGEVLDLAVSSAGTSSQTAVLTNLPLPAALIEQGELAPQRITLVGARGAVEAQGMPPVHVEQIELASGGIVAYGNSQAGQYLGKFEGVTGPKLSSVLTEKWRKGDARVAEYSSSFVVASDRAKRAIDTPSVLVLGFEEQVPTGRRPRLAAFAADGTPAWSLALPAGEGAFYYTQAYAPGAKLLVAVTDDGVLHAFSLR